MLRTLLLILLILLLIGALPTGPYSTGWGYYPSGRAGLLLVVLIVLVVGALRRRGSLLESSNRIFTPRVYKEPRNFSRSPAMRGRRWFIAF